MLIACSHCLATNRVPDSRLNDAPVCGQCGSSLLPDAPVELSESQFSRFVTHTELPVVVDFWAPWCGPCRAMAPHFAHAAQQAAGRALFVKVNTDEAPNLSAQYGIRSIPTLAVFRQGRLEQSQAGTMSAQAPLRWAGV